MSRTKVALWLLVLAPIWPLLFALAVKDGRIPAELFGRVGAWYVGTHPIASVWIVGVGYGVFQYFVSLATGNASVFDVHWSVLPASVYVIHFSLHPSSHPDELRSLLVIGAIWAWGMRLTGNWLKKGGLGFEDFRYEGFRRRMSPLVFQVFSFWALFVVQSAMVIVMTMPAWYALRSPGRPVGALDWVALGVILGAVLIEWIADLQGMAFRERREAYRQAHPEDLEGTPPRHPRFPSEGLWRYSRHPNYFGEIMVWWGVYLFGVAQSGAWLNWTIVGPLTIHGLFLGGSVGIAEKHELSRKPEYADYQRRTSRLVPWFPSR